MKARAALVEQLLGLAWSHWVALGVAGSVHAADEPIDLEALMILTAELATEDPRLRDEALDWCSRFHGFSSKPRLKQLLRRSPPSAQSSFASFANALEKVAGSSWPGTIENADAPPALSGKSRLPPLSRPALLSLRLRALFGIGARADLIAALLPYPADDFSAADLVCVGYSKRNLAEALDMLAAAGLFRSARTGNRVRFSWLRHAQLSALFDPLPSVIPPWATSMRLMSGLLELSTRLKSKSDRLSAVEAGVWSRHFESDLQVLRIEPPPMIVGTTNDQISDWVLTTNAWLTRGGGALPHTHRALR